MLHILLVLLQLTAISAAYTLRGSLAKDIVPLSAEELANTFISVTSLEDSSSAPYKTYLRKDGHFSLQDLAEGSYQLELHSINLALMPPKSYRIDIVNATELVIHEVFAGHSVSDLGPRASYPLVIGPVARKKLTMEREQFSAFNMLKSPMMLMSLGGLVMIVGVPKLVKMLDPEAVAEFQKIQAEQKKKKGPGQSRDMQKQINNFDMAEFLAGKTTKKQ
ncbi:UPF0620 protein [Yarrowia sp. C11]|nr:UPF0620 protein [Yarrowia sp. E02]KAG5369507.1 UPF0620 protein [Yarrowia sp. C11]